MKKIKLISVFLAVVLMIPFFPAGITAQSSHSKISGSLSLPSGEKATADVEVTLTISTDNLTVFSNSDDVSVTKNLTIAKGKNAVKYSIEVPKSTNSYAKYSVSYTVGDGYAPFGYYAENGTTAIKNKQTRVNLNSGDISGINIELLPGRIIEGKLFLPYALSEEIEFTLTALQEGDNLFSMDDDMMVTQTVTIPKNKKEVAYTFILPANTEEKGYQVFYRYTNGTYMETGFYSNNNTSELTRIKLKTQKITGINMTTQPFTGISGRVYLPDGKKAPEGGCEIDITAYNAGDPGDGTDDFHIRRRVIVPKGSNYVNYYLTVPVKQTGYSIDYTLYGNTDYVPKGYYNESGTTTEWNKATLIEAAGSDISGINLTLQKVSVPAVTPTPTPTPTPEKLSKYDLNNDRAIDFLDMMELGKVIYEQYEQKEKDNPWNNGQGFYNPFSIYNGYYKQENPWLKGNYNWKDFYGWENFNPGNGNGKGKGGNKK